MSKILFLAQFAPTDSLYPEPQTPEEQFYANTYHLKIYEILKKYNYDFDSSSDVKYLMDNYKKYDLVWSVYNRLPFRNSEIFVQSLCEYLGVKYIGATPNIRALVEDKSMSKQLAEHLKIPTANWVVASPNYPLCSCAPFPGPYFVKPRFGSASLGIDETCICSSWDTANRKAEIYFRNNVEVIVERFIDGIYYGVPILNTIKNKPIIAIPHFQTSSKKGNVITYSQKRFADEGMERSISNDNGINTILTHFSTIYFQEIQSCDYARIDYIIEKSTGIPYFLEVNVLMNLGIQGGFVSSFLNSGFENYDCIINHILQLGLSRVTN